MSCPHAKVSTKLKTPRPGKIVDTRINLTSSGETPEELVRRSRAPTKVPKQHNVRITRIHQPGMTWTARATHTVAVNQTLSKPLDFSRRRVSPTRKRTHGKPAPFTSTRPTSPGKLNTRRPFAGESNLLEALQHRQQSPRRQTKPSLAITLYPHPPDTRITRSLY
jgi:hypothetical protein